MAAAAMAATCLSFLANAEGRFDKKLSTDQQIVHALNRLTFGPRPGDIEEVRRVGVAKWIELQLHPDQIPENPVLDARLKPLETLRMDLAEIVKEYTPAAAAAHRMIAPAMQHEQPAFAGGPEQGAERNSRGAHGRAQVARPG